MTDSPDLLRILSNIGGLLQQGQFPGRHAEILAEALQFVASAIADATPAPEATASDAPVETTADIS